MFAQYDKSILGVNLESQRKKHEKSVLNYTCSFKSTVSLTFTERHELPVDVFYHSDFLFVTLELLSFMARLLCCICNNNNVE